ISHKEIISVKSKWGMTLHTEKSGSDFPSFDVDKGGGRPLGSAFFIEGRYCVEHALRLEQ
ncbi:MAG: hypothetical protein AAFS00_20360, partial [Bacteroidota bacterium]